MLVFVQFQHDCSSKLIKQRFEATKIYDKSGLMENCVGAPLFPSFSFFDLVSFRIEQQIEKLNFEKRIIKLISSRLKKIKIVQRVKKGTIEMIEEANKLST